MKLPVAYYLSTDTLSLARDLIGKILTTKINGVVTQGIISETEAYLGAEDKASHAYGNRYTQRTATMFQNGGRTYVYLCYGIHHLFNVVTGPENHPHAILVRGIIPFSGKKWMLDRRGITKENKLTFSGPGKVSMALGITTQHNGLLLTGKTIWIEDHKLTIPDRLVAVSMRIGVDYAGIDALLPYRFLLHGYEPQ